MKKSKRTIKRKKPSVELNYRLPLLTEQKEAKNKTELKKFAQNSEERIHWAKSILGVPEVWRITQGEGVKVAILDTGVDTDHPDLKDAIVDMADFTGDGIEDYNGHGTHCAGIVGARLNGIGFVGVAPKSELMIGKVLNNKGRGANAWITEGVYWAVENGAHILSLSLGGGESDPDLYDAIQYALFNGVFIFCAAGNDGSLATNSIGYPARLGGVLTIASHDRNGNPSGFSSRGGEIDVMAPGSDIWSTYKNGGYRKLSGTSMATPFVAGLAALITSKHMNSASNGTPLRNNEDMKNHLLWMATHPGHHDNATGYGPLQPFNYFYG